MLRADAIVAELARLDLRQRDGTSGHRVEALQFAWVDDIAWHVQ